MTHSGKYKELDSQQKDFLGKVIRMKESHLTRNILEIDMEYNIVLNIMKRGWYDMGEERKYLNENRFRWTKNIIKPPRDENVK
jgi:hypothetical protein